MLSVLQRCPPWLAGESNPPTTGPGKEFTAENSGQKSAEQRNQHFHRDLLPATTKLLVQVHFNYNNRTAIIEQLYKEFFCSFCVPRIMQSCWLCRFCSLTTSPAVVATSSGSQIFFLTTQNVSSLPTVLSFVHHVALPQSLQAATNWLPVHGQCGPASPLLPNFPLVTVHVPNDPSCFCVSCQLQQTMQDSGDNGDHRNPTLVSPPREHRIVRRVPVVANAEPEPEAEPNLSQCPSQLQRPRSLCRLIEAKTGSFRLLCVFIQETTAPVIPVKLPSWHRRLPASTASIWSQPTPMHAESSTTGMLGMAWRWPMHWQTMRSTSLLVWEWMLQPFGLALRTCSLQLC